MSIATKPRKSWKAAEASIPARVPHTTAYRSFWIWCERGSTVWHERINSNADWPDHAIKWTWEGADRWYRLEEWDEFGE